MFVHDVMTRDATTVTAETTVKQATELLAEHRISSLPVLDEHGRVCGVVSEADLIRDAFPADPRNQILHDEHETRTPAHYVADVMTPHALTVHETTDVARAAELMTSTSVKCVPVVDDAQRLVGVLSRSDLVRVRARADGDIEREVDSALVSLGHNDWLVEVSDGGVEIDGPVTAQDRSIAEVAAGTVPGVVTVRVR